MKWLAVAIIFLSMWCGLLTGHIAIPLCPASREVIFMLPIYLLMSFACYSLAVVGYRVATFNDCTEASDELKQQIEEAKRDLRTKGLKI